MITLLILKVILITFLLAIVLLLFINFIGLFFTGKKKITITNSYFHSSDDLYKAITNISAYPEWKQDLIRTEMEGETWKEYFSSHEVLKYRLLETDKENQILIQLESGKFPLNLVRTYRIWNSDHMTFLQIEDNLTIKKAYLRVFSSLFYDHSNYLRNLMASLDKFLDGKALKKSTYPFL